MLASRRLVPVIAMGSFAIFYVLMRPLIVGAMPYAAILEFPIGAAIIAALLWAALSRKAPAEAPRPWRRHAQVVRTLPDPMTRRDVETLERWVETGEGAPAAADVLARASSTDAAAREATRARLAEELTLDSRRRREAMLKQHTEGV